MRSELLQCPNCIRRLNLQKICNFGLAVNLGFALEIPIKKSQEAAVFMPIFHDQSELPQQTEGLNEVFGTVEPLEEA